MSMICPQSALGFFCDFGKHSLGMAEVRRSCHIVTLIVINVALVTYIKHILRFSLSAPCRRGALVCGLNNKQICIVSRTQTKPAQYTPFFPEFRATEFTARFALINCFCVVMLFNISVSEGMIYITRVTFRAGLRGRANKSLWSDASVMATKHECAQGSDIIGYRLQGFHGPMFVGAGRSRSFVLFPRKEVKAQR